MKMISLVVPVYQNEKSLAETAAKAGEVFRQCQYDYQVVFVNDGSTDKSLEVLRVEQTKDPEHIIIINFTRNFGQRMAIIAGLEYAKGDAVGVVSADLQDPIELLSEMISAWENGFKIVMATRTERKDGFFSDLLSNLFHTFIRKFLYSEYPKGGSDYWLLDRVVLDEYNQIKLKNGSCQISFLRLGYSSKMIEYTRKERTHGKSQYNFWKRVYNAYGSILPNSYMPIRLITGIGLFASISGFIYAFYVLVARIIYSPNVAVEGWTTIIIMISIFAGLILLSLGIIGEYIWRIYDEIKTTPRYVVDNIIDRSKKV